MSTSDPTFDRGRPGPLRKAFFKGPTYLYWGPIANLMAQRCVMLLTTTGRKSGQPRSTGVSFMPVEGRYIAFSGWGVQSDWYKNLLVNPDVTIRIGNKTIKATAKPVEDPQRRKDLMLQMRKRSDQCGPPPALRGVLSATGVFDYEGDLNLAVQQAEALPVVEITPISGAAKPA